MLTGLSMKVTAALPHCSDFASTIQDSLAFVRLLVKSSPDDFDDEARLLFLGDCHVAGKQKWDAQEVAEHVYRMVTQLDKSHDFIARTLRMSKTTVGRYVDAYEMHSAYLRTYPFPGNQYKWSYFLEFQKKKPLKDRRRDDPEFGGKIRTVGGRGQTPTWRRGTSSSRTPGRRRSTRNGRQVWVQRGLGKPSGTDCW